MHVEFGSLKVGEQFTDLGPAESFFGDSFGPAPGSERKGFYVKVRPKKIKGRKVNAQHVRKKTFCWITPSHRVEID